MTGTLAGASRYLEGVFVAVLLAPVLPDILLDFFGGPSPHWRNPVLRGTAVFIVILACIGAHQVRRWYARRREGDAPMPELRHYPVLVQPLSANRPPSPNRYSYRPRANGRTGDKTVPEVNVDSATPRLVIAVASPQITHESRGELQTGLAADGVKLDVVDIPEPNDVKQVVPEVTKKVLSKLREHQVNPSDVCFDTTGGNVPISLAMLRAAAIYGSDCCYVSSQLDRDGRTPYSQLARSFDPTALFGVSG